MTLQEFINFVVVSKYVFWDGEHEKMAAQVRAEYPGLTDLNFIVPHLYTKLGSARLLNLVKAVKRCTGLGLKECKDAVDAYHKKVLAAPEENQ